MTATGKVATNAHHEQVSSANCRWAWVHLEWWLNSSLLPLPASYRCVAVCVCVLRPDRSNRCDLPNRWFPTSLCDLGNDGAPFLRGRARRHVDLGGCHPVYLTCSGQGTPAMTSCLWHSTIDCHVWHQHDEAASDTRHGICLPSTTKCVELS